MSKLDVSTKTTRTTKLIEEAQNEVRKEDPIQLHAQIPVSLNARLLKVVFETNTHNKLKINKTDVIIRALEKELKDVHM